MPSVIETLTLFVALQGGIENEMMFCAYSLTERIPTANFEKEIRATFSDETFNVRIKSNVSLWK